ncbi:hypothetical protein QYF36_019737 [Acer negundo]|nr:hypothetical protein QYF36_019737 [Acer negundo]
MQLLLLVVSIFLSEHEHEHEHDIVPGDDARLKQLGYKQELSRSFSAIANFCDFLHHINTNLWWALDYDLGMACGGPPHYYCRPFDGRDCFAYPTSSGLYFWSAKLYSSRWGPLASWFTGMYHGIRTFYGIIRN